MSQSEPLSIDDIVANAANERAERQVQRAAENWGNLSPEERKGIFAGHCAEIVEEWLSDVEAMPELSQDEAIQELVDRFWSELVSRKDYSASSPVTSEPDITPLQILQGGDVLSQINKASRRKAKKRRSATAS